MKIAIDKVPNQIPQSTRIIFLLDRSSSMEGMKSEAVSGYNQFLANQQKVEGEATISLIFFDSNHQVVYENAPVKSAQPIVLGYNRFGSNYVANIATAMFYQQQLDSNLAYQPQGMTSLFDTIHNMIMKYKETSKSNEKTIFAILTDGEDTSSRTHTYSSVQKAIKEAQDGLGWEVLFVGANMNARGFAQNVGIKMSNVTQFDYTKKGIGDAINTMSFVTSYARGDSNTRSVGAAYTSADGSLDMSKAYDAISSGKVDAETKKNTTK